MGNASAFSEGALPLFDPAEGDEATGRALPERLPSYIRDHRQRLRARFVEGGPGAMPDYELLELVLFRAIPRQDVKPLARLLLDTFGDFNRVISAEPARLAAVRGIGEAVIVELKIVEAAAQRMARARVMNDRKNVLIADEEQAKGTVDHVPVYPREVVKRALELNASALILVHNHPSGDPTPSDADVSMTLQIQEAARVLGLVLHDHLIVGKSRELSFRAQGYL
jgi:DNA repair protein RadC